MGVARGKVRFGMPFGGTGTGGREDRRGGFSDMLCVVGIWAGAGSLIEL